MRSHPGRGAFAWAMLVPHLCLAVDAPRVSTKASIALRWSDESSLAATTQAGFEANLSERLGHAAFDSAAAADTLTIAWRGSPRQCRIDLQLLQGSDVLGTRRLQSPSGDCESLVPVLLTVSALLIESRLLEPESKPEPEPAASPASFPPLLAPKNPSLTKPEPKPETARALLGLGAVLGSGLSPQVEIGPAASVVLAPSPRLRVGVLGTVFLPRDYESTPGLSLSHDSLAFSGCGMPLLGRLRLGACANLALHRFHSKGVSLARSETAQSTAWTTGLALRTEWRITRPLWWVGSLGADVATRPLYFYYTSKAGGERIVFHQHRLLPVVFLALTAEVP